MKKSWVISGIFVLVLVSSFFIFQKISFTGNAVSQINPPADCTENNIKSLWDSIFLESSTGIQFVFNDTNNSNGKCDNFLAAKTVSNNESYLLWSVETEDPLEPYNSWTVAKKTQFNSSEYNYTTLVSAKMMESFSARRTLMSSLLSPRSAANRSITISSTQEAQSDFSSTFKSNFVSSSFTDYPLDISFSESENYSSGGKNFTRSLSGQVSKNLTDRTLAFEILQFAASSCTPNWTKQETACYSNETKTIFYNDSNTCGINDGKPSSTTERCDNDLNGILGSASDIDSSLDLEVFISGAALNISKNYSNSTALQKVEVKRNSSVLLSFYHNFSKTLDFSNIEIKADSNSSSFGYVIVNGLSDTKTVYLTRKNSSNGFVCIYDGSSASLNSFSSDCGDDNEFLVSCPGNLTVDENSYNCTVSNNLLTISGLQHSAVKEFSNPANCTPSWNCTSWSSCLNGTKNRTCADKNNCGSNLGKPNLTEICVAVITACVPSWSCSNWSPLNCSNNVNQTRTCADKNNCNVSMDKPSELFVCPMEESSYLKITLMIIFALSLFIIVGLLIYMLIKKKSSNPRGTPISSTPIPPVNPSSVSPLQPSITQNSAPEIPEVK